MMPDSRRQIDGVAEPIRSRQDADRPAPALGDEVDRGLDHPVGRSDQVGIPWADSDGQHLIPGRFDVVARNRPRIGDRDRLVLLIRLAPTRVPRSRRAQEDLPLNGSSAVAYRGGDRRWA